MAAFRLVVPDGLDRCLDVLKAHAGEATVLAGGTDLSVLVRSGIKSPDLVVWIGKLRELRRSGRDAHCAETAECDTEGAGSRVCFGPGLTHSEIASHSDLGAVQALRKAASSVGSPQVRNAGTAGGNLANASPAADLYPPLLVLEAALEVRSAGRRRTVGIEDFVKGPGRTALGPDELLTGIAFREPGPKTVSDFVKVGLRNAVAISVASAAILASSEGDRFGLVRVACGAVAPLPIRMRRVEALLEGERLTPDLVREVEEAAARECDPITDMRASREYRRHVVGVIVSRLVESAWHDLRGRA
jgi:CO/xanthine dehydrogenase FAD-binding subunit